MTVRGKELHAVSHENHGSGSREDDFLPHDIILPVDQQGYAVIMVGHLPDELLNQRTAIWWVQPDSDILWLAPRHHQAVLLLRPMDGSGIKRPVLRRTRVKVERT